MTDLIPNPTCTYTTARSHPVNDGVTPARWGVVYTDPKTCGCPPSEPVYHCDACLAQRFNPDARLRCTICRRSVPNVFASVARVERIR